MMAGPRGMTASPRWLLRRYAALIASVTVLTTFAVLDVALWRDYSGWPTFPVVVGLGLLAGFVLGLTIAWAWDRYSGRLRSLPDIEEATGLPVQGLIPSRHRKRSDQSDPAAEDREAYRQLAGNLVGTLRASGASCLLITSPTRRTGRSTVAANLAASFATGGMRVALVSADPRNGSVDELLGLRSEPGLMEALDGSSPLHAVVQASGVERLSVIAAGTQTGPGEVGYNLDDMALALDRLTKRVDLVVVEAPPVLGTLDTALLAQEADHVLLAIDIRHGRKADASLAVSYLGHVDDRLIGCVANDPGRRRLRRRAAGPALIPAVIPEVTSTATPDRSEQPAPVPATSRRRHPGTAAAVAIGKAPGKASGAARAVGRKLAPAAALGTPRRRRWAGVIATAITVAVVISSVWWLSYDDDRSDAQDVGPAPSTPLAATAASDRAIVEAAMEECRATWEAQAEPLDAAAETLKQWGTHIAAMNQLVAGKITLDQANAFWEQTREQAGEKVDRFRSAQSAYANDRYTCRIPTLVTTTDVDTARLTACKHQIAQRDKALQSADVAVGTWHHHVMEMNMLRAGTLSPSRAVTLWLEAWKEGAAELKAYRVQLRHVDAGC
jgi:Mrp family chromosome partitioning ATPase